MERPENNLRIDQSLEKFPRLVDDEESIQNAEQAFGEVTEVTSRPVLANAVAATSESTAQGAATQPQTADGIVYHSERMNALIAEARAYARSTASVLISGESGTGKELFAKLIHNHSQRADQRFVQVNCAALSDHILESEFFGHAKGAFTGADQPRVGRFEWANGGTLLLDEVSEIPVRLQAKLLRVLEERVFQKVGCNLDQHFDVRVISTSNRNLEQAVADGTFRDDLYHRLNVLQLDIPPLRERMEDLGDLCHWFARLYSAESEFEIQHFSPEAMERLKSYTWPGNVRQLRNVICRACVLATSESIQSEQIKLSGSPAESIPEWLLSLSMSELEKKFILANLQRFGGNKTKTAQHLGVTSRTLHNKMKSYLAESKAA